MAGEQRSGSYYVMLEVAIRDVETYLTYMDRVTPALEAAGDRYLARGGALTTYEGEWDPPRIVLIGNRRRTASTRRARHAGPSGARGARLVMRRQPRDARRRDVAGIPPKLLLTNYSLIP